jgi:hypothetical protein
MDRQQKTLVLALSVPLILYGIPYAYAATVSSSYVVFVNVDAPKTGEVAVTAPCNSGDYATGGGYSWG